MIRRAGFRRVADAYVIGHARLLACAASAACASGPPPAAPGAPPALAKACASPEHRALDFWIGDWDLEVRARASVDSATWGTAKGHQHVETILGGCAIAEHFAADGPQQPWAGASYSVWQPKLGRWRQTWVDDSGNYLAFTGGIENGAMTLYGEPREQNGKAIQMRMVFLEVTPSSLRWEWQRSDEHGPYAPLMIITYRRAAHADRTDR